MSNLVPAKDDLPSVEVTPMHMLQLAVQQGANVDQLTKLMDLQERFEATEARKAFVSALNKFKESPPSLTKNKAVDFQTQKGRTHYRHATLDNVSSIIGEALSKVGISHRWDTEQLEGGLIRVTCVLTHERGHSERTPLQAKPDESGNKNSIQAVGSTVTYLQRYTLLAATGMAVSDGSDDDGRQGKKLPDNTIEDFKVAISELTGEEDAKKLWQKIASATTAAGDVEAHEELRSAMAAKRKSFKVTL